MSLFIRFPISVVDASLPVLSSGDVDLFSTAETSAFGHWLLGGNSVSLTSLVGSEVLTPQDLATLPVYSNSYITHTLATGKSLLTSRFEDSTLDAYTLAAVHRVPATYSGLLIPSGTLGNSPALGGAVFSGAATAGVRPVYSTHRGITSSLLTPLTFNDDQWFFVACSLQYNVSPPANAQLIITIGKGGVTQTYTSSVFTNAYQPNTAIQIALGNSAYTGITDTAQRKIDTAEFLVFNSALSAAAQVDLYARSSVRMAQRGITI